MLPFKMNPVFRHGADTPWGGEQLKSVFGKSIPDAITGESLEISALPGYSSMNDQGIALTELLQESGTAMLGTQATMPFPLLLKLIDARDKLSVQVHPDDAYAKTHEGGKLGKTEAWVILQAAEGAEIVYGIKHGTSREQLRQAMTEGQAIEELLEYVPVHAGDVFYIPAGMVHAIGAGILLYEIQQSSDLTYRFWDWDRKDANGISRELHLEKALDVTRLDVDLAPLHGKKEKVTGGLRTTLINDGNFALQRLEVTKAMPLEEMPQRFRMLTAFCKGHAVFPGGVIAFQPGDSLFIPASSPRIKLECAGELLLASPSQ